MDICEAREKAIDAKNTANNIIDNIDNIVSTLLKIRAKAIDLDEKSKAACMAIDGNYAPSAKELYYDLDNDEDKLLILFSKTTKEIANNNL